MADKTNDDGGTAFPEAIAVSSSGDVYYGMPGMTLRQWYAGQALPTVITASLEALTGPSASFVSTCAFDIADAMIAAEAEPRQPVAPDVVDALELFVKQWNACGSNSDFGRYFSNVREAAVAALAAHKASAAR